MKKMMMMLIMATVALTASAQNTLRDDGTFTLQPKVGIGFGSLSGDWISNLDEDRKMRIGFLVGLEGEYYVNSWLGIAAGVNYAQQGWKFKDSAGTDTYKLDYLNIPVTADFYVAKGLALKTGMQFGFLMSGKVNDRDVKDSYEKFNFSIPIGISYEISNIVLDLRYNLALSKAYSDNHNKWRSDLLQITVGYKIPL
jgi:hypothetical protein